MFVQKEKKEQKLKKRKNSKNEKAKKKPFTGLNQTKKTRLCIATLNL